MRAGDCEKTENGTIHVLARERENPNDISLLGRFYGVRMVPWIERAKTVSQVLSSCLLVTGFSPSSDNF